MKKVKTVLRTFNSNLWSYHFPIPNDIAELFIEGDNKRVICTLANGDKMQSAIMHCKEYPYVLLNKTRREKLGIYEGDETSLLIEKDHSEFGMEYPMELQEMFDQEPEALIIFKKLTMGKQRSLVYIVNKVKNPDSRIKKALAIVEHLKECEGNLDFKRLNVLIKKYNNM